MFTLDIPASEEKNALELAKANGGKLLFDPDDGTWMFVGRALPEGLSKFEKKAKKQIWVLDVPFTERSNAQALGASWKKENKAWVFEGTNLPLGLIPYLPLPFSWEEKQATILTGETPHRPKGEGVTLHKHQVEAQASIVQAYNANFPGFLLADEVGLGKTYATWAAVQSMYPKGGASVLIVSPLGVVPVWREALIRMGDGNNKVLVINYDRLNKLFEADPKAGVKSLKGLARRGKTSAYDVIIWDESHYLKSMCADNPAARAKLADKLYTKAGFLIWLSATAGQNLLEVGYLKPLLTRLGGKFSSLEEWSKNQGFSLTRGEYGKWLWEPSEVEEQKLNSLLFSGKPVAGLRRRPQEIVGWPEIKRVVYPIEMDSEQKRLYALAWAEFIKALELDRQAGKISTNGLAALLRLRQKASLLKVAATVETTKELIASGKRVPISVEFLDSVQKISEGLTKARISHTIISGSSPNREGERIRFQKGEVDAIIFTLKEGISLHEGQLMKNDKPRTQIVHDLRWSGINQHQIDGRSHRNGQYCPVYWMVLGGTVEIKVSKTLLAKLEGMAGIMGDTKEMLLGLMKALE